MKFNIGDKVKYRDGWVSFVVDHRVSEHGSGGPRYWGRDDQGIARGGYQDQLVLVDDFEQRRDIIKTHQEDARIWLAEKHTLEKRITELERYKTALLRISDAAKDALKE